MGIWHSTFGIQAAFFSGLLGRKIRVAIARMRRLTGCLAVAALAVATLKGQPAGNRKLEAADEAWVAATLKKMTLDEKVGQLLVSSFGSEYLSTDSPGFDALVKKIHEQKIGGFHVFGGTVPVPDVLLDTTAP